jgi:hypothetical protein
MDTRTVGNPTQKEALKMSTDPHHAEAAAAVAGMAATYGYRPSPGDIVIGERPFLGDRARGVVRATNGTYCLVEIQGETLAYYPTELTPTGERLKG